MEAGLPDVTGDDSGGAFTGLAPLSTRSTSKSASLLYPGYHLQLPLFLVCLGPRLMLTPVHAGLVVGGENMPLPR